MRINLITFNTSLTDGGIQNTGYLLADSLARMPDIQFSLLTDSDSSCPRDVDSIRIGPRKHQIIFWLKIFYKLLTKRVDINWCLQWTVAVPCLVYRCITRTPYAVMVHGSEIMQQKPNFLKVKFNQCLRRSVLKHASIIFANSEYTRRLCAGMYKKENIIVIHPPVCSETVVPSALQRTYTLFSVGRHIERKGFQDVIRAIPELRRKYPRIRYRLAGEGPFHSELVALTRELGLEGCVEFLGKISEQQKGKELQNCDIFIMTSHTDEEHCEVEGFGICYLEANAYGKWVIARDSGGVSDAVIDGVTGRLLPNSEPEAICGAVDEFYTSIHPDTQKMREWAQAHNPEAITQQYIEQLKKYEK